jgi:hypothetical protein
MNCIRLWHWADAPKEYRDLSTHGGDEDWVMHCPVALRGTGGPVGLWPVVDSDEDSYVQGYGHVDRHDLPNGDLVVIFAHA